MKPGKKLMITMLALFTAVTALSALQEENSDLQLFCNEELAEMARILTDQYRNSHPGIDVKVNIIPDKEETVFSRDGITLVKRYGRTGKVEEYPFRMIVGRDVIIPVVSERHPGKEIMLQKGLKADQFASIYRESGKLSWGQILGTDQRDRVVAYLPAGHCSRTYLADFTGLAPGEIGAVEVAAGEEMIRRIAANPNAIGFCSLSCLSELEKENLHPGITAVPIDMDGDGGLSRFEDIYNSYAQLAHGIYIGKYPRTLYSRVYAIGNRESLTEPESDFMEWVITGGQAELAEAGILNVDYSEKTAGLNLLNRRSEPLADVPASSASARTILLLLGTCLVMGLMVYMVNTFSKKRKRVPGKRHSGARGRFAPDMAKRPAGLYYDRTHTWTFMEKTGQVKIGVDDFIQHVTGSVSRVILKSTGEKISRGDTLFTLVQQGKQLRIKSPLSGIVTDRNDLLLEDAALINRDPYFSGWIYSVEPLKWMDEIKSFFMGEPYVEWLKAEFIRLKDFLSASLQIKTLPEPAPVLQDGGEIIDGVLEEFGPEVWEEFQTCFMDHK